MIEHGSIEHIGSVSDWISDDFHKSRVYIYSVCPQDVTNEMAGILGAAIDESEQLRLARFKDKSKQQQYLSAHVLLRVSLSRHSAIKPNAWRFAHTHYGQPYICLQQDEKPLFFSISYRESLAICAVTSQCRIGVDVEKIDSDLGVMRLADSTFSTSEREWWVRENAEDKIIRFYELWTLKEAFLKAVGQGLYLEPSCIGFHIAEGSSPTLLHIPGTLGMCDDWSFCLFHPTKTHTCALAMNINSAEFVQVKWKHVDIEMLCDYVSKGSPCMGPKFNRSVRICE